MTEKGKNYKPRPIDRSDYPDARETAKVKENFFPSANILQYVVLGTLKKVGRVLKWSFKVIKAVPSGLSSYVYRHSDKEEVDNFIKNSNK